MIKLSKRKMIGILIIAGILTGFGLGLFITHEFRPDTKDLEILVPMVIIYTVQLGNTVTISGVPDQGILAGTPKFLNVEPYINSPFVPISFLTLSVNRSGSAIVIFNHNKTIKFDYNPSVNTEYDLKITVSFVFDVGVYDIINVSVMST